MKADRFVTVALLALCAACAVIGCVVGDPSTTWWAAVLFLFGLGVWGIELTEERP